MVYRLLIVVSSEMWPEFRTRGWRSNCRDLVLGLFIERQTHAVIKNESRGYDMINFLYMF